MEPPPSLPTPPAERPAAIAAASPPLEPPGVRVRSPGIIGAAVENVVGLVGHQKFGHVGIAEQDRSRGAQPRDERRVFRWNVAFA